MHECTRCQQRGSSFILTTRTLPFPPVSLRLCLSRLSVSPPLSYLTRGDDFCVHGANGGGCSCRGRNGGGCSCRGRRRACCCQDSPHHNYPPPVPPSYSSDSAHCHAAYVCFCPPPSCIEFQDKPSDACLGVVGQTRSKNLIRFLFESAQHKMHG